MGGFKGLHISHVLYIFHLLFVDDILMFCDGSRRDLEKLEQGLNPIEIVVGMVINDGKPLIVMSRLDPCELHLLENKFPYHIKDIDEGLKYLDLLLKTNDYWKKDWDWLVEKIEKIINLWCHRWISRVGRLVLIKSILESILVYWASLSWIPKGILAKIRRICFSYLWRGIKNRKVLPWVRWD